MDLWDSSPPSSLPADFLNKITIPSPSSLFLNWLACHALSSMSLGLVTGRVFNSRRGRGCVHRCWSSLHLHYICRASPMVKSRFKDWKQTVSWGRHCKGTLQRDTQVHQRELRGCRTDWGPRSCVTCARLLQICFAVSHVGCVNQLTPELAHH